MGLVVWMRFLDKDFLRLKFENFCFVKGFWHLNINIFLYFFFIHIINLCIIL